MNQTARIMKPFIFAVVLLLTACQNQDNSDKVQIRFHEVDWYAQRAAAAYQTEALIRATFPATQLVATSAQGKVQYFMELDHQHQRQIIAVRGTDNLRNIRDDVAYIERFIMEEWVGRRIDNPYVVKVVEPGPGRRFLYYLTEDLPGPSLAQKIAGGQPMDVAQVVAMAEKLVQGLRSFHRRETLHQDIKPDNIVMKGEDPVIIDFGSVYVAGVDEIATSFERERALGTLDYSAPEYRLQRPRSEKSDQFSLAMVIYEMLTGKHPFGERFQKATTVSDFLDLKYIPAYRRNPMVPVWLDGALRKAMQTNADLRYDSLSEFVHDLKHPNPAFLSVQQRPLLERDPAGFWRWLALLLLVTNLVTLTLWLG